jgi:uncharacterized protein (TIGR02270 family)
MHLPDFSSEKPTHCFHTELYQEHLEEASFLYEQRLGLFDDPEITWLDIGDFEERLEAHLDALVVGEKLGLEVCKTQAAEGDFGELYAAICVFCRQGRKDMVAQLLQKLDLEDSESVKAVTDALKYEFQDGWASAFARLFSEGNGKLIPLIAKVFGYRRLGQAQAAVTPLEKLTNDALPDVLWTLGRLGDRRATPRILPFLQHDAETVRSAAALALLRLGHRETVEFCHAKVRLEPWAALPLSLAGGPQAVTVLRNLLTEGQAKPEYLFALGLLGDLSTVPTILEYLADTELAEHAALALQLMTGADLFEEVFIPEEISEDELFEDELVKFKESGEIPMRPDGQPFGENIVRLSQRPEDWQTWFEENGSSFKRGLRYRYGLPYSPAALLRNLESENGRTVFRWPANEELVIRYGMAIPFEVDLPVTHQQALLKKIEAWIGSLGENVKEGGWYCRGGAVKY